MPLRKPIRAPSTPSPRQARGVSSPDTELAQLAWAARREALRLAVTTDCTHVLYPDLDHVLRWAGSDPDELRNATTPQEGSDCTVIGRSQAGLAAEPARRGIREALAATSDHRRRPLQIPRAPVHWLNSRVRRARSMSENPASSRSSLAKCASTTPSTRTRPDPVRAMRRTRPSCSTR